MAWMGQITSQVNKSLSQQAANSACCQSEGLLASCPAGDGVVNLFILLFVVVCPGRPEVENGTRQQGPCPSRGPSLTTAQLVLLLDLLATVNILKEVLRELLQ